MRFRMVSQPVQCFMCARRRDCRMPLIAEPAPMETLPAAIGAAACAPGSRQCCRSSPLRQQPGSDARSSGFASHPNPPDDGSGRQRPGRAVDSGNSPSAQIDTSDRAAAPDPDRSARPWILGFAARPGDRRDVEPGLPHPSCGLTPCLVIRRRARHKVVGCLPAASALRFTVVRA